jgi:hypothetical protein
VLEWTEILKLAGQLTTTGVLAFVAWKLWGKIAELEATIKAKDVVILNLQDSRINDLKTIARQND